METQNNTWFKMYRKINEWEWYKDIPVKVLFIHLLTKVNFTEKKWQGRDIKKGEVITSLKTLSQETGLSIQEIRTSLMKLKSTHEITSHSTSTFTHIQLVKWEQYQSHSTSEVTNEQQTSNKPTTTTREGNKGRKKETNTTEIGVSIETTPRSEARDFFESLEENIDEVIISINPNPEHREVLRAELFKFYNYWCEKTPDGKRVRWQTEKTFEVKRRLATWFARMKQPFNSNQSQYEKKGGRIVG